MFTFQTINSPHSVWHTSERNCINTVNCYYKSAIIVLFLYWTAIQFFICLYFCVFTLEKWVYKRKIQLRVTLLFTILNLLGLVAKCRAVHVSAIYFVKNVRFISASHQNEIVFMIIIATITTAYREKVVLPAKRNQRKVPATRLKPSMPTRNVRVGAGLQMLRINKRSAQSRAPVPRRKVHLSAYSNITPGIGRV